MEIIKMINTLPEVKKFVKEIQKAKLGVIQKISVNIEEFGEGFNTYVTVEYANKELLNDIEGFTLAEEEKKSKAIARAERVTESLKKLSSAVVNEGITTW